MDTNAIWHAVEQHVLKSLPEYSIIFGLFLVAVIANMIKPSLVRAWLMDEKPLWTKIKEGLALGYEWFYDSMQAFMAARHPQPPVTAAVVTSAPTVVAVNPTQEKE